MTAAAPAKRAIITTPSDREIHIERIVDAPRDRVWRAFTDPALIAQWWGGQGRLNVEKMEVEKGGHWRFVDASEHGINGFEGRYREVTPPERLVYSFEWDGMPAHVIIETVVFEDLGDGRTKIVNTSIFHTQEERDGMLQSGMESGMNASYEALDRLLEKLG